MEIENYVIMQERNIHKNPRTKIVQIISPLQYSTVDNSTFFIIASHVQGLEKKTIFPHLVSNDNFPPIIFFCICVIDICGQFFSSEFRARKTSSSQ